MPRVRKSFSHQRWMCAIAVLALAVLFIARERAVRAPPTESARAQLDALIADGRYALAVEFAAGFAAPRVDENGSAWLCSRAEAVWRAGVSTSPSAMDLCDQAVAQAEAVAGERSRLAARCRLLRARARIERNQFEDAHADLERVIEILGALDGPDSRSLALPLALRGFLEIDADDSSNASVRDFGRAAENLARGGERADVDDAECSILHSRLLVRLGRLTEAVDACRTACATLARVLRPRHPLAATAQHGLGFALYQSSDLSGAAQAYETALAWRIEALGPDHPSVAGTLYLLSVLREALGQEDDARSLLERAIAIYTRARGADAPESCLPLRQAGRLALRAGDLVAARASLERCWRLTQQDARAPARSRALVLGLLGDVAHAEGDVAGALETYALALAEMEPVAASTGADRADLWAKHGSLLATSGERAQGLVELERALALRRDLNGADAIELARVELELGSALANDDDAAQRSRAFELVLDAARIARAERRDTAGRWLEERAALSHAANFGPGLDATLELAANDPQPGRAARAFDALVRARGVVFDELALRRSLTASSDDPAVEAARSRLVTARRELADCAWRAAAGRARASELSRARDARESAENELARQSEPLRARLAAANFGFDELLRSRAEGCALVSWVRVETANGAEYQAWLLPAGDSEVHCAARVDAAELEERVREVVLELREHRSLRRYRECAAALRKSVWDPLEPMLASAREILLVPDGALCWIDFAALPVREAEFVVEHAAPIHYLTTERDLLPARAPAALAPPRAATSPSLLAVGDVEFGSAASEPPSGARDADAAFLAQLASSNFSELPKSGEEARSVVEAWRATHTGATAELLCGRAARKDEFLRLAPRAQVLHVATHAFYLSSASEASSRAGDARLAKERLPLGLGSSASLRSGILFSGALPTLGAGDGRGVLLAEEVLGIDLSLVQLAVLSACDTGFGDIQSGEGVFGLRRAFQLAGVRTLVASLWPLVDESAPRRMRAFYAGLWERGETPARALHSAALARLAELRAGGIPPHPRDWAGLIAIGGWDAPRKGATPSDSGSVRSR